MYRTQDLNVKEIVRLSTPHQIKAATSKPIPACWW